MVQPNEDRILYLPSHVPSAAVSFHLDENISQKIADRLREDGFDVTTTDEAGLRSESDRTQIDYAMGQQRVIVTRDQDFVQFHHQQHPHAGIVYWPHPRLSSSPQMVEMLVQFLRQICTTPGSELALVADHPSSLPLGTVLRVQVRRIDEAGAHVVLESGYPGLIEHTQLPRGGVAVDDHVEAVVVRYVKSRKRLMLSARRNFTFARTMPDRFQRQLRKNDHRILRQIEQATESEIVRETPNRIRVFSDSLESLHEAADRLREGYPWTCEAVGHVERNAFRRWVLTEFGGLRRFGEQMQVRIDSDRLGRLLIASVADSLVENALNAISTAVPELQVHGFLKSFIEPPRSYGRAGGRFECLGSIGQPMPHPGIHTLSRNSGKLVQQRLKLVW
jgi:predicted nuclease of predicted toxin-antitoxin system/predicted RNA-binding protein with RPS1 domain